MTLPLLGPGFVPWLGLIALGAFHGLNPSMGWLLAVSRGLEQRRARAVATALGPIACGHVLSIGAVVAAYGLARVVLPLDALRIGGAAMLALFGTWQIVRARHVRWDGSRVARRDLLAWSFLMSTAHGAGLMLVAVLAAAPARPGVAGAGLAFFCPIPAAATGGGIGAVLGGVTAVGVHAAAMLVVMGAVALAVYAWLGIGILRRLRLDLDRVWGLALLGAAALLLLG